MKELSIEEVKAIQLDILCHFDSCCKRNNICYWIDSGTLLGAVRHKGYIPWDDDIDTGMLRPDYEKLIRTFNQDNERYKFVSLETDESFYLPHGKVLDTRTVLYEGDSDEIRTCVNIDVFVYDNAPENDYLVKLMYDLRDFYRNAYYAANGWTALKGSRWKRAIGALYLKYAKTRGKAYFIRKMINNSRRYAHKTTERVGNFTSFMRFTCDRHVFDEFETKEFEGHIFPVPAGYDLWLRSFYGDYMQLPPLEKRVSHHRFRAYTKGDYNV